MINKPAGTKGRGVRCSRCPAAVKGTKAHKVTIRDEMTSGWEDGRVDKESPKPENLFLSHNSKEDAALENME